MAHFSTNLIFVVLTFLLALTPTLSLDVGYNSECQLDSECRAKFDSQDICCALLIYEANNVQVKKRECLPKSTMAEAAGAYTFEGVTTTNAYCDGATSLYTAVVGSAITGLLLLVTS